MWYAYIALVKPLGYEERAATPGATERGTSFSLHGPKDSALLVDLHQRCEVLFTRVSKHGWHELDDRNTYECTDLPLDW